MSTVSEQQAVRVDPDQMKRFVASVYEGLGMGADDATLAAEVMVRTDMRGQHTHGVWYLQTYVEGLKGGGIRAQAKPKIVRETPATAVLDGDGGLGAVVTSRATEIAASKARDVGSATVLVRNSNHFGAAGIFTTRLAEQGLIGIVAANTTPGVGAPGAIGRIFGTQPISYAVPDPDGHGPVMLDMALSQVAGTKVMQTIQRGEPIPEGWLIGPDGLPTTDVNAMREGGSLAPVGGHKGYGLGMLVEILSGVLSGAGVTHKVLSHNPTQPSDTGHWVSAFDPEAFMPMDEFKQRLAALRAEIHAAPTAEGVSSLILPGEPEFAHEREARESGLEIEGFIWESLVKVADEFGRSDALEEARR